jgi:DNA polymerase-1
MDDTINFAREHGYVQTLMGRKRVKRYQFIQLYSKRVCRAKCDQLSNTGKCKLIWIKLAMIKVHCAMKKEGFLKQDDLTGARMIGF